MFGVCPKTSNMKFGSVVCILALCFASSEANFLETHYMPAPCINGARSHIYLDSVFSHWDSSGLVKLTSYNRNADCSVVLHPFGYSAITISVVELTIESVFTTIDFTDGYTTREINGYYPYSGQAVAVYTSKKPGADVTITFKARDTLTIGGFRLVYTAFINGTACIYSSLYQCDNGRCIAKDLPCDGYNHCGDFSDEVNCGPTMGAIVGYIFGCLFLVVAAVCIIVAVVRRKRKASVVDSNAVVRPLTGNYPPTTIVNPMTYPPNPVGYQQQVPYPKHPDAPPSYYTTERENPMYH